MKITEIIATDNDDYRSYLKIQIDDKMSLKFIDGEPEDATMMRDFNDVYSITNLMEKAWLAGKQGEELTIETKRVEWEDI